MPLSPAAFACLHLATPEERRRDPGYTACGAQPEQPCRWAHRYDGLEDPAFHSERLEGTVSSADLPWDGPEVAAAGSDLRDAVLRTGLV